MREPLLNELETEANKEHRTELVRLIASEEAIAFVGAGLSRRVGYPDWGELVTKLEELAGSFGRFVPITGLSRRQAPEYVQAIREHIKSANGGLNQYWNFLGRVFGPRTPAYSRVHCDLMKLPFKGFITSNYDPSWTDVTEDDILRERGARPDAPENKPLRQLYEPLRDFADKWSNNAPPEEEFVVLLPTARNLFAALQTTIAAEALVILSAWTHLCRFAHQAVRGLKRAQTDDFRFLRTVILEAANHPSPEPSPEFDAEWADASWSPAPRNEAAQTLPRLTHFGPDAEVLNAIERLSADPVPSVRFLLACELWRVSEHAPEVAWRLLTDVAEHEPNSVVLGGACVSLWNMIPRTKENSLYVLKVLYGRLPAPSMKCAFSRGCDKHGNRLCSA